MIVKENPYREKSICLQIAAEVNNLPKVANLTYTYFELSETLNSFVKIHLVIDIKNVTSFIKHIFIENEAT